MNIVSYSLLQGKKSASADNDMIRGVAVGKVSHHHGKKKQKTPHYFLFIYVYRVPLYDYCYSIYKAINRRFYQSHMDEE